MDNGATDVGGSPWVRRWLGLPVVIGLGVVLLFLVLAVDRPQPVSCDSGGPNEWFRAQLGHIDISAPATNACLGHTIFVLALACVAAVLPAIAWITRRRLRRR